MRNLPFILLIVLVVIISLALFIGLSLGIGWLLTLFLPFSLFEATLLGMLAAVVTGLVWYRIFRSLAVSEFLTDEDESEPDEIPESRFWESPADRTWKNWFRYVLANSVYEDLLDSSSGAHHGEGRATAGMVHSSRRCSAGPTESKDRRGRNGYG